MAKKTSSPPPPDAFCLLVRQHIGIEPIREYKFHPTRKWRFDYAIPSLKIAIECDGGVWIRGRHNSPTGYIKDMEKTNAAASLGWLILKFTPQQLMQYQTIATIKETIETKIKSITQPK